MLPTLTCVRSGNTWRALRTRTRPSLPLVVDDMPMADARFEEILAASDAVLAKTASELLGKDMRQHFSDKFWSILQDARVAWM
jgi:hypothetical protein